MTRQQRRARERIPTEHAHALWLAELAVSGIEAHVAAGIAPESLAAAVDARGGRVKVFVGLRSKMAASARKVGCALGIELGEQQDIPNATWCLVTRERAAPCLVLIGRKSG